MKSLKSLTLAFVLGSAASLQAQFSIPWSTFDGGGTTSGGAFTLNGTIGQSDAGVPMSGGAFSIAGGFWVAPDAATPRLSIRLAGANTVVLTWPDPSTGYTLQQTANMNSAGGGWADVTQAPVVNGANKEVTLPASGRACGFRLRRP